MFGLHLIRTGAIERAWASHLGEIPDDRLAADYDVEMEFTTAEAVQACQRARAFLDRIRGSICLRKTLLLTNSALSEYQLLTIRSQMSWPTAEVEDIFPLKRSSYGRRVGYRPNDVGFFWLVRLCQRTRHVTL
jgi:hypothetical protein